MAGCHHEKRWILDLTHVLRWFLDLSHALRWFLDLSHVLRWACRFFADRIMAISYMKAAFTAPVSLGREAHSFRQLRREDVKLNKVSPNDSINSAVTSVAKFGSGSRSASAAPARAPAASAGSHQQVVVPHTLFRGFEHVLNAADCKSPYPFCPSPPPPPCKEEKLKYRPEQNNLKYDKEREKTENGWSPFFLVDVSKIRVG